MAKRGKRRVLLTGAAGGIGTMFLAYARDRYDFVCLDRRPTPGIADSIVTDLGDLETMRRAASGCDTVVHLAAYPNSRGEFLSVILPNNVIGTYNAYEAAALAGVRRFVFASSIQVDYGYPDDQKLNVNMTTRPSSFYGASKTFGENLGRVYARKRGLSVICLRFGMVVVPRMLKHFISSGAILSPETVTPRDSCEIIIHSIEAEGVGHAILPAFSRSGRRIRDLSPLKRVIGYEPQDDVYKKWGKRSRRA